MLDRPMKPVDVDAMQLLLSQFKYELLASPARINVPDAALAPSQLTALKNARAAYDVAGESLKAQVKPVEAEFLAVQAYVYHREGMEENPKELNKLYTAVGQHKEIYQVSMLAHRTYRVAAMKVLPLAQRTRWARTVVQPYALRQLPGVTLTPEQETAADPIYREAATRLNATEGNLITLSMVTDFVADQLYAKVLTDAQRARVDTAAAKK
jgi:hypothetical protein